MKPPRSVYLGTISLVALACGQPMTSRELEAATGFAERNLQPILKKLCKAGIIESTSKPSEAYRLVASPERIRLSDIEQAFASSADSQIQPPNCEPHIAARLRLAYLQVGTAKQAVLGQLTLDQFAKAKSGPSVPDERVALPRS